LLHDDSASPVAIGEVIAGKYRVERVLGRGGMGVVVAALHIELDQLVALKFLRSEATAHPQVVARFAREARAAAKIQSEHVARVIDVGVLPTGAPFVVMEFMDGEDLARILARRGPLPVESAVGYLIETCEAIAEAHALGIVHRDLKPANLFLAKRIGGRPILKVLDFGISKSTLASSDAHLTKTSAVVGSPLYMSPEQLLSSKSVDVRSDIWALGVVLYEFLTAEMPFLGETLPEVVAGVMHGMHQSLRAARADLPAALEAVVDRCLAKDPGARFANAAELAAAVAPFGPRWSQASVERIAQALGLAEPVPPSDPEAWPHASPERSPPPAVSTIAAPTPGASRRVGPLARRGVSPGATGWNESRGSTATTATTPAPVSSDEPLVPAGVPTGWPRLKVILAAASVLTVVGVSASAFWRAPSMPATPSQTRGGTANSSPPQRIDPPTPDIRAETTSSSPESAAADPVVDGGTSSDLGRPREEAKVSGSTGKDELQEKAFQLARSLDGAAPAPTPPVRPTSAGAAALARTSATDPTPAGEQGFLNINSIPAASILLDGKPIGSTPKLRFPVTAGEHSVLFLNADQGFRKQVSVTVGAGDTRAVIGTGVLSDFSSHRTD
jgi:hypothetical protein